MILLSRIFEVPNLGFGKVCESVGIGWSLEAVNRQPVDLSVSDVEEEALAKSLDFRNSPPEQIGGGDIALTG